MLDLEDSDAAELFPCDACGRPVMAMLLTRMGWAYYCPTCAPKYAPMPVVKKPLSKHAGWVKGEHDDLSAALRCKKPLTPRFK